MDAHRHCVDQFIHRLDVRECPEISTLYRANLLHPIRDAAILDDFLVAGAVMGKAVSIQVPGDEISKRDPHQLHVSGIGIVAELGVAFLVAFWAATCRAMFTGILLVIAVFRTATAEIT